MDTQFNKEKRIMELKLAIKSLAAFKHSIWFSANQREAFIQLEKLFLEELKHILNENLNKN